jgi:N-acetylglucosamine malate deacetylase 1
MPAWLARLHAADDNRPAHPRAPAAIGLRHTDSCVHLDHAAVCGLASAAVFYARLSDWEHGVGATVLGESRPWVVERLFFPHCKMEPPWGVTLPSPSTSARPMHASAALAEYGSIFNVEGSDRLVTPYEAEDSYIGGCST